MNNNLKLICLIIICVLAILGLEYPISLALKFMFEGINVVFISELVSRCIILVLSAFFLIKFRLYSIMFDFGRNSLSYYMISAFFLLVLLYLGILINSALFEILSFKSIVDIALLCVIIGLFEEIVFRGFILVLSADYFKNKKYYLYYSSIISSIIFGLMHFRSLNSNLDNFDGVLSLVVFAFSMGMLFSALYVRSGNLIVPIVLHIVINFAFGIEMIAQDMGIFISQIEQANTETSNSFSILYLINSLLVLSGLIIIKGSDSNKFLEKLSFVFDNYSISKGENQTD